MSNQTWWICSSAGEQWKILRRLLPASGNGHWRRSTSSPPLHLIESVGRETYRQTRHCRRSIPFPSDYTIPYDRSSSIFAHPHDGSPIDKWPLHPWNQSAIPCAPFPFVFLDFCCVCLFVCLFFPASIDFNFESVGSTLTTLLWKIIIDLTFCTFNSCSNIENYYRCVGSEHFKSFRFIL